MTWHSHGLRGVRLLVALGGVILALPASLLGASRASAAEGPVWQILAVSNPTNIEPGGTGALEIELINVGAEASNGSQITISDSLAAGLTANEIFGTDSYREPAKTGDEPSRHNYGALACSLLPIPNCTTSNPIDPGDTLLITIPVSSTYDTLSSVTTAVTVSGGGGARTSASDSVTVSFALPEYGLAPGGVAVASSSDQAGAHANVTASFFLNTVNPTGQVLNSEPTSSPKDVGFDMPPGLVGTTVGMPRCTMAGVIEEANCPADTMIGTATLLIRAVRNLRAFITVPVYNIAPAPGEPVAFAFNALLFPVRLDTSVLSNGNYGVRIAAPDITEGAETIGTSVTVWGVPADHHGSGSDHAARSLEANGGATASEPDPTEVLFGGPGVGESRVALLSNPTQCSTRLEAVSTTDPWEGPDLGKYESGAALFGPMMGCEKLSFGASVSMLPDTLKAGAPAGYSLDLQVPQSTGPDRLATPNVKKVVATLPSGTVISPSAADGLGDCSDAQFGLHSGVAANCPRESQVGTVQIKTPALEEALKGEVFLAAPSCDPCSPADAQDGRVVRLFVQVIGEGESGIIVKLEGVGQINQQTGQITTTFNENPQLPFSEFKLTLGGGERATLANPRTCGPATTTLDLTPWSTPFTPDATPSSTFDVTGCYAPQFNPTFAAGTTSNQAGEYSPFTLSFGRSDADEFLNGLQLKMPPGLLGMLSKVTLCGEQQASAGTCGSQSLIGHTTVETGPGADPFLVTGGQVFITGPYKGAPYGLSIVVPAVAGPYTLSGTTGNGTVVVRAAINVDPTTSALTVTADPLPTELDGIPLQLRLVNVTIDREGFTFNPTSCAKMGISATMTSTEAASATGSSSFQVTNCGALAFKPQFSVSTSGKTSRKGGASLDAKVVYPLGPKLANVAKVKVDLPKQLPSRLTTLQKACTSQTFAANPGDCPAASRIGVAKASTPVLPGQLMGPVYFVSHGGEQFPELVIVLQYENVRVDLKASTFISKAGITSSTFNYVPDVPISSFELYLPEGPYSALAANGNLCTAKLAMPTAFVAQNGAEIHESTKIAVTGCPKAKKATGPKARKGKDAKRAGQGRRAGKAGTAGDAGYDNGGVGRTKR